MIEKKLTDLCRPKLTVSTLVPIPYWTAQIYSFGRHIRDYGRYPMFLPLCIYTDHGPGRRDYPFKHELESDAPCQFYHSPTSVAHWKAVSSKPCYVLYSPFVFFRKKNGIERNLDARGTIAFPAHSTAVIDDASDVELYIEQLKMLPKPFQPVSACLHMHDINKGRHKVFLKHGIPVHTAGYSLDYRFAARFYDILRKFSFATSNIIGSYTYYAVEMGIPFSLYGNKQIFINKGDKNVAVGEYDPYREFQAYRTMHDLFNGLRTTITPEQKNLVETDLGLKDGISRDEMSSVLYASLFKWITSSAFPKYAASSIRRTAKLLFDKILPKDQIKHGL